MFGTDEECGSSCVQYYIDQGEELPVMGFTPDADYPCIFCEKGMTNYTLGKTVTDPEDIPVVSFQGGTAANVVTPYCRLVVQGDMSKRGHPASSGCEGREIWRRFPADGGFHPGKAGR